MFLDDDLAAAHARITELENMVAHLKSQNVYYREEWKAERDRNHELRKKQERKV